MFDGYVRVKEIEIVVVEGLEQKRANLLHPLCEGSTEKRLDLRDGANDVGIVGRLHDRGKGGLCVMGCGGLPLPFGGFDHTTKITEIALRREPVQPNAAGWLTMRAESHPHPYKGRRSCTGKPPPTDRYAFNPPPTQQLRGG